MHSLTVLCKWKIVPNNAVFWRSGSKCRCPMKVHKSRRKTLVFVPFFEAIFKKFQKQGRRSQNEVLVCDCKGACEGAFVLSSILFH